MKNSTDYILVADDDMDDQLLVKHAFAKHDINIPLQFVNDGEELLIFLEKNIDNKPSFIMLDLNMPKKNGKDCLKELKANGSLKEIPVLMFTTSSLSEDVKGTYDLGASSYIHKPTNFDDLLNIVKIISNYWFKTVLLPKN